jgi:hypothetical protein
MEEIAVEICVKEPLNISEAQEEARRIFLTTSL